VGGKKRGERKKVEKNEKEKRQRVVSQPCNGRKRKKKSRLKGDLKREIEAGKRKKWAD